MKTLFASIMLGVLTFFAISAIDFLPYQPRVVEIQDMLNLPGTIVFGILWPEGVHSEGGGNWVIVAVLVNIFTYSFFWFAAASCIKLILHSRKERKERA